MKRYFTVHGEKKEGVEKRKEKRKVKNRIVFVIIFVISSLSLFLFLRSPLFTVTEITVTGLEMVPREELFLVMGLRDGMNMWKLSPPEIRNRALTVPQIKEVEVERVLPDKLFIDVQEKDPFALVPYHGYYLEVASDGVIIGLRNDYEKDLPLITGLSQANMDVGYSIANGKRGDIVGEFLEVFYSKPSLPVKEIDVKDPDQIIVYSWEGVEIWLGKNEELPRKLEVMDHLYHRLLKTETNLLEGYLDLRAVEAPVFKPF